MKNEDSLKILLGLLIVTIILFAQTAGVSAINDQGLVWGIEVGNRFDYNIKLEYHSSTMDVSIDDKMYVIVDELNTIPDYVTQLSDLTIFSLALESYTTYWENGTIMDDLWFDVLDVANPFSAYPVGNWSLLAQIFEDASPVVITQNTTMMNCSLVDFPVVGNVHETIFLKSSGVPHSILYIRTWDSGANIHLNLTMIQTPTGTVDIILALVIGGVVLVTVVAVVVIIRRK
ncbi:MAG: hypothetical protein OEV85_05760 [Candidatus Thorarchaeota archaeon]|nr:hypothetical protein [Candidatus Thorarchaeota archaeon]